MKKKGHIINMVLASVIILMGIGAFIYHFGFNEENNDFSMDVLYADRENQYVFAPVLFMTEPILKDKDKSFYVTLDKDWYMTVISMSDEEAEEYKKCAEIYKNFSDISEAQAYAEQATEDDYMYVYGYSRPITQEIKEYFVNTFGAAYEAENEKELTAENVGHNFGEYYIEAGPFKKTKTFLYYGIAASVIGFFILFKEIFSSVFKKKDYNK